MNPAPSHRWCCCACENTHDSEYAASQCCTPYESWFCLECGDGHGSEAAAHFCCDPHKQPLPHMLEAMGQARLLP